MSIFRHLDYRTAIFEKIKNSKVEGKPWSNSGLADSIGVQRGYITRVFKKEAHLNTDQLFLTTKYLDLPVAEVEFLFLLLEFSRSIVQERKKNLLRQIKEIQSRHRDTRKHLKTEMIHALEVTEYNRYYLDPYGPIIHIFLSLPKYASDPSLLIRHLNITEMRLQKTIQLLEELHIIRWNQTKKTYELLKDHIQLVADSPFNLPYQLFQRNNAIQKIQSQTHEDRFIFSVTFSANNKTKDEIHEEFLKFLKKVEALVKETTPQDVFQMNFDLFGWTS